jgi:hypothetical protein
VVQFFGNHRLTEVVRPDGLKISYGYTDGTNEQSTRLSNVTQPEGAKIQYNISNRSYGGKIRLMLGSRTLTFDSGDV